MIYTKKTILFLLFTLVISSNINLAQNNQELLSDFLNLLTNYGWDLQKSETGFPTYNNIKISGGTLTYQIPSGGGYYEKLQFYILTYNSQTQVPLTDGNYDQVYPYCFSEGAFPIDKYKNLFEGVFNWEHFEYIRWNAYRRENKVYLIYANPVRQDIDYLFNLWVHYNQAQSDSARSYVENILKKKYKLDKELFESYEIIQGALKANGFYNGKIDGMFGSGSIKALQKFLKSEGFNPGTIDGDLSNSTKAALKKFQENSGLQPTGEINIETALKIKE